MQVLSVKGGSFNARYWPKIAFLPTNLKFQFVGLILNALLQF
jgi:hypothetical protein